MGLLDRFRSKPTLDSFARDLMAGIRKAGHPDELRYEPSEQVIHRLRDGEAYGQIGLANMFQAYREAPKGEQARLMGVFVRSALSADRPLPDDYEAAQPDLRPRLWNRASIEMHRAQGSGPDLVAIPVGGHILASVVYDWPETVQSITPVPVGTPTPFRQSQGGTAPGWLQRPRFASFAAASSEASIRSFGAWERYHQA